MEKHIMRWSYWLGVVCVVAALRGRRAWTGLCGGSMCPVGGWLWCVGLESG
jgi:hypothetical protein